MELRSEMSEPRTIGDDTTSTTPRIVNGMPVRRREKVNVWSVLGIFLGSFLVSDTVALLAVVPCGVRRILRYLDARGKLVGRPDVLK